MWDLGPHNIEVPTIALGLRAIVSTTFTLQHFTEHPCWLEPSIGSPF